MGKGRVTSKQNPTAPTFRQELSACSKSGLGGALHPRKATSNFLKPLTTTLSMSKSSTRDPSPKMNLLWVWVQLMLGPPAQRWAVLLLTVTGECPFGYNTPLQQRSRGFPGRSRHTPCSHPCRYEHPLKSTATPHLPRSLLLHLQSKASLGDNRRQLWEAKVTGVPRTPSCVNQRRQNDLQALG